MIRSAISSRSVRCGSRSYCAFDLYRGGWLRKPVGGNMKRNLFIGSSLFAVMAVLGTGQHLLEQTAGAQAKGGVQAPRFEVDPMWPKPLPNHWLMGNTIGVGVDTQDHVYIIHRGATLEAKEVYATENPP